MSDKLRSFIRYMLWSFIKPEGFNVGKEDYTDDELKAFLPEGDFATLEKFASEPPQKEVNEDLSEELPADAPEFTFSLSLRDARPVIKGLNADDAEERFLNKTLKELGVTRQNYKIM